jgi:hypothetical protein
MARISKTLIAINLLTVAIILSAVLNAYLIRTDAGGIALWNAKEAYFFIGQDTRGRHVKWIGYPLLVAGEFFGHIEPPDDDRGSMFVLRVTPEGVERHVLELADRRQGSGPSWFTPLQGRIWANYPTLGGLCWWAGDHFERANQEELRRLGEFKSLNNRFYENENGWSKNMVGGGQPFEVKLGDDIELVVFRRLDAARLPPRESTDPTHC